MAEISAGGSTFGYGFLDATSAGSLSQEEFTYYGTEYSILLFYRNTDTDPDLWLGLNPQGATAFDNEELSLVVDGTAFSFGDAVFNSTGQWVWAESGLNWADGDRAAVRLLGPPPPPVALVSATVSGTALTLTYDTGMDQTSVPAASAFTVDVDAATTTVSSVAVAGAEVTLTLASTPASTATVTVDYAVPATNPLRSLPAVIVPTFSDQPVAHIVNLVKNRSQAASFAQGLVGTLSGESLAVAQQFDTGGNAAGYLLDSVDLDVAGVEANTDPRVSIYTKSGSNPGTLVHTLANPSSVADGWRTFTAPPGALLGKDTDYFVVVEHTRTTETFTLGLTASDAEDSGKADGWGIANTRRESVDGTWGTISSSDVVRIHVQGAIIPNRLATGAPAITGTAAVGQTLAAATAGISDPDGTTKAEAGDTGYAYTYQWIRVDSDGSSNATDISGATGSTYVLASADEGKKIKLEAAFTDDADTDEEPLTSAAYPPTGTVAAGAANADPVFMDGASTMRDFDETIGDAAVATASNIGTAVAATDADLDTLTYSYSGADAARFGFVTTSGQLQTKVGEKYSYETDTSYSVTLTVTDGNGGSDSIDVTLNVADQDEPPLRPPMAPGVNGHGTDEDKLRMTLTRVDNTGRPSISGYRIRLHRAGFTWTELQWNLDLTRTAAGVNSGTRYTVQYRARNDEGEGPWSPSGFGSSRAHATGMPDITGTAEVTQTLTAGTSGISDGNGKSKAENGDVGFAYTYQWVRRVGGTDSNISGATSRTYTLTAADEGNKVKVKARFTDNAGYAEGPLTSSAYPATGTIAPAPDPELSFANTNITVDEDAGTVTLTVELDPASAGTVTVDFATSDQTALAGVDYTAASGTLTFAASETSKTITVPILNDTAYDPTQRFRVTLSNASGATLPTSPWANVNINNDDAVPTASIANVTVGEGAGTMTLTLALDRLSNGDITYSTVTASVSGTATVADDYVAFLQGGSRDFTVPAGNLSQAFNITVVDDSLGETNETIGIVWTKFLSHDATPASIFFTGTITDNDTAGVTLSKSTLTVTEQDTTGDTYTVVLNSEPTADVVVTVAGHAGTDVTVTSTPLTFTTVNWSTAQVVTVTAADDADTADDTVTLTHTAASTDSNYNAVAADVTVTVEDNDTAQVTGVTVDPAATMHLLVGWTRVSNATGYQIQWKSGGEGYSISRQVDIISNPNTSSVLISGFTNGTEYTMRVRAVRSGANNGPWSDDAMGTPEVPTALGVTLSKTALTVTEEDATGDSYTVVLDSEPTADVVVTVAGHGGTDVTATSTPLTFTTVNWSTAQVVTVTAADDADTTDDTVVLTHSAASTDSDYDGIAIDGVTVTVEDNDSTAAVTPPALVSATVSGTALTLTYDKNLDEDSVPAAGAYAVDVDGTAATVSSVAVDGIEATLTLASTATSTATTTVDYVVPATNPLRSTAEVDAPAFAGQPVAHIVDLVRNRSQAAAGSDGVVGTVPGLGVYAAAQQFDTGGNAAGYLLDSVLLDVRSVEANGDPQVSIYTTSGSNPGTLVHTLSNPSSLADGWRTFTAPPGALLDKDTDYFVVAEHTRTTNTFTLTLTASDAEDPGKADGWGIANSRRRSVDGTWGAAPNSNVIRIQVQGAIVPNRVATGAPTITGTAAVGETLTAATADISDADGTTKAEAGDTGYAYTYQWIRVDSDGSSNATDIPGATATSTYVLVSADEGKKIKVEVAFADDADNDEGPLTSAAYPATGTVAATSTAPVFDDGANTAREFAESEGEFYEGSTPRDIGAAVSATDADMDTLEYSLEGTDAGRFSIVPGSGQITTKVGENYDYETSTSYAVTVKAVDGNGGEATIAVAIGVTDVDEPPLGVYGLMVTLATRTSLNVEWTARDNTGRPPVTHHILRHKTGSGPYTTLTSPGSGTSASITGLAPGTRYEWNVHAVNDEGGGLVARRIQQYAPKRPAGISGPDDDAHARRDGG